MLTKLTKERRNDIESLSQELAVSADIPMRFTALIGRVAQIVDQLTLTEQIDTDPTHLDRLQAGLLRSYRAAVEEDRRGARIGLEQVRVALRDIALGEPFAPTVDARDLARWLDGVLVDVPNRDKAWLVDTSERSWQRWQTATTPSSSDAGRLRLVARTVGHLRFALSPQGIIDWFRRPHPALDGRSPHEVLHAESAGAERVARLAATVRVSVAA